MLLLASSMQAISFLDYYHGNPALGIRPHEKEIHASVANGRLDLSGNKLTDLIGIETVPGIDKLVALNVNNNHLKSLPDSIGNLVGLYELFAENNELTHIPELIGQLYSLMTISLAHNHLTSIPKNISSLRHVRVLNLRDNEFTMPPEGIKEFVQNVAIFLENNPISLSEGQLLKMLELPHNVKLSFRLPVNQKLIDDLISAIRAGNATKVKSAFRIIEIQDLGGRLINATAFHFFGPNYVGWVNIAKVRDAQGNNLLHMVVNEAAEKIELKRKAITGVLSDEELSDERRKEISDELIKQIAKINDVYMKILSTIFSCGDDCVQEMLFTPNARGEQVIDAVFSKLGPQSPIFKALVLTEEGQEAQGCVIS